MVTGADNALAAATVTQDWQVVMPQLSVDSEWRLHMQESQQQLYEQQLYQQQQQQVTPVEPQRKQDHGQHVIIQHQLRNNQEQSNKQNQQMQQQQQWVGPQQHKERLQQQHQPQQQQEEEEEEKNEGSCQQDEQVQQQKQRLVTEHQVIEQDDGVERSSQGGFDEVQGSEEYSEDEQQGEVRTAEEQQEGAEGAEKPASNTADTSLEPAQAGEGKGASSQHLVGEIEEGGINGSSGSGDGNVGRVVPPAADSDKALVPETGTVDAEKPVLPAAELATPPAEAEGVLSPGLEAQSSPQPADGPTAAPAAVRVSEHATTAAAESLLRPAMETEEEQPLSSSANAVPSTLVTSSAGSEAAAEQEPELVPTQIAPAPAQDASPLPPPAVAAEAVSAPDASPLPPPAVAAGPVSAPDALSVPPAAAAAPEPAPTSDASSVPPLAAAEVAPVTAVAPAPPAAATAAEGRRATMELLLAKVPYANIEAVKRASYALDDLAGMLEMDAQNLEVEASEKVGGEQPADMGREEGEPGGEERGRLGEQGTEELGHEEASEAAKGGGSARGAGGLIEGAAKALGGVGAAATERKALVEGGDMDPAIWLTCASPQVETSAPSMVAAVAEQEEGKLVVNKTEAEGEPVLKAAAELVPLLQPQPPPLAAALAARAATATASAAAAGLSSKEGNVKGYTAALRPGSAGVWGGVGVSEESLSARRRRSLPASQELLSNPEAEAGLERFRVRCAEDRQHLQQQQQQQRVDHEESLQRSISSCGKGTNAAAGEEVAAAGGVLPSQTLLGLVQQEGTQGGSGWQGSSVDVSIAGAEQGVYSGAQQSQEEVDGKVANNPATDGDREPANQVSLSFLFIMP